MKKYGVLKQRKRHGFQGFIVGRSLLWNLKNVLFTWLLVIQGMPIEKKLNHIGD